MFRHAKRWRKTPTYADMTTDIFLSSSPALRRIICGATSMTHISLRIGFSFLYPQHNHSSRTHSSNIPSGAAGRDDAQRMTQEYTEGRRGSS